MNGDHGMANGNQRHHLFVSYASVDDEPFVGMERGWITYLISNLKVLVDQKLGRRGAFKYWMDYQLSGNEAITPTILGELNNSDTILLVLTEGYLNSGWCQDELSTFLGQNNIDDKRIFVIEPKVITTPEALHDLKGYRFYTTSPEGSDSTLGWPIPDPDQRAYFAKLSDLATDIAAKIKEIRGATDTADSPPQAPPDHTILLAPVTEDLMEERERLRRSLQQRNIRVLPESDRYPINAIEEKMAADLEEADLYVQLLNETVGMGNPVFFHQCAVNSDKPRLLWHREGLDITQVSDTEHLALLQHETVIVSDETELHHQILHQLHAPPPISHGEGLFLFVNHAPEDAPNLAPLIAELEQLNIGYVLPLPEEEADSPAAIRQDLERNILDCDAQLMLCYDAPIPWAREQLMIWRKSIVKREQPPRGIGVCKEPNVDLAIGMPKLQLIDCSGRCPKQCLNKLQFVRRQTGGGAA